MYRRGLHRFFYWSAGEFIGHCILLIVALITNNRPISFVPSYVTACLISSLHHSFDEYHLYWQEEAKHQNKPHPSIIYWKEEMKLATNQTLGWLILPVLVSLLVVYNKHLLLKVPKIGFVLHGLAGGSIPGVS
jgi:hypothetical protein